MSVITLTTDFGWQDWYVGTMKGVITAIAPQAQIIDISHGIAAGNVLAGALALASSFRFFAKGTIHLAVVDPGVGSSRAPLAVEAEDYFFVGPDNGILSLALAQTRPRTICRLENKAYQLNHVSRTFHGRDIFAPAAAHLSRGVSLLEFGPQQEDYERVILPKPKEGHGCCHGEVIHIDHFGNAITNLREELLGSDQPQSLGIWIKDSKRSWPLGECYQSVSPGSPLAIFGSTGFLEIAVNGGNAAKTLELRVGDLVSVETQR